MNGSKSLSVLCPVLGPPWAFHTMPSRSFQCECKNLFQHEPLALFTHTHPASSLPSVSCVPLSTALWGSLQRPQRPGSFRALATLAVSHMQTPDSSPVTLLLFQTTGHCLVLPVRPSDREAGTGSWHPECLRHGAGHAARAGSVTPVPADETLRQGSQEGGSSPQACSLETGSSLGPLFLPIMRPSPFLFVICCS